MNRGEIRTAVKQRLAIPSSGDGQLTDTVLDSLINTALAHIAQTRQWPWLLTSLNLTFTNGQSYVPTDFILARALVYDSRQVTWMQFEDFLNAADLDIVGYGWTIVGNVAQLTPVPSAPLTATLYYYRAEPELYTDYSVPIMPAMHHHLIVAYASYLAALVRQDEGRAAVYMGEYSAILGNMRDDLKQNTSRRIRYHRGFDYASWD